MGEPKIVVVDYHKGNLSSVVRGLARAGAAACTSDDPEQIRNADGLVIPGVGAFYDAIAFMRESGEADAVLDAVAAGTPLLGICLGLQLFFERGNEGVPANEDADADDDASEQAGGPWVDGLGIMRGSCTHLESSRLKVPHVGWDQVRMTPAGAADPLLAGFAEGANMYFTHSYAVADDVDAADVLARTHYTRSFPCIVRHGNVWGCQFHPEKSSALGQRILKNFVSIVEGGRPMILFPAIDLIGGKVVRLERGDRSRCKVYSDDPVAVARSFAEQGASWVHVVDLSAAFGEDEDACAANLAAIKAICGVDGLSADVGGGVRSLARIDELAGYGARRIALGTVLVTEPGFAEVAAQGFGELLVADIAARDGQVKVNGWRDGAGVALDDAVAQLTELGFKHLVYTDIARDGMQTGIDVAAYRHVAEVAGFPVVASGGISMLDDIRALAAVGEDAIEGAITGRALYEGNFTLAQALAAARGKE